MATQVQRWLSADNKEFHSEVEANAHDATVACLRVVPRMPSGASENKAVYDALFYLFRTGIIRQKQSEDKL